MSMPWPQQLCLPKKNRKGILVKAEAARLICLFGRRLYEKGLIAGNQGNISVRLSDGNVLITPRGRHKGFLEESELVTLSAEGEVIEGLGMPSSESLMHLSIYSKCPDYAAICHAHPINTVIAFSGVLDDEELGSNLPEGFDIPVLDFPGPGSEMLAREAAATAIDYDTFVLFDHGVVACGRNLEDTFIKIENLEYACKKLLLSLQLMGPDLFDDDDDYDGNGDSDESVIDFNKDPL